MLNIEKSFNGAAAAAPFIYRIWIALPSQRQKHVKSRKFSRCQWNGYMMVNYEGVTTPYSVGKASGNLPD
jgi:hypothetical protein